MFHKLGRSPAVGQRLGGCARFKAKRDHRVALLVGTGTLALATGTAHAACSPDPVPYLYEAEVVCSGVDADGINIGNYYPTKVHVQSGATVQNSQSAGASINFVYGGDLKNEGTIDGGVRSAVRSNNTLTIDNSGTITSAAASDATLVLTGELRNSGLIAATGGAFAILNYSYGSATIHNEATGIIQASGGNAIGSAYQNVRVVNSGVIDGNLLLSDNSYYVDGDRVEQRAGGKINGSVQLGAGNDQFLVEYVPGSSVSTGVSGVIDGGAGTDRFGYLIKQSGDVALPVLPVNFEQYLFELAGPGIRANLLNSGSPVTAGLEVAGMGEFVINGNFTVADGAVLTARHFVPGDAAPKDLVVTNRGTLKGGFAQSVSEGVLDFSDGAGFASVHASRFVNEGEVHISGNSRWGIIARTTESLINAVENKGLITGTLNASDSVGVYFYGSNLVNSGTIRFSGQAVAVYGASSVTNSGTIEAEKIAVLGGRITNTGTIRSTTDAAIKNASVVVNQASGVISGASTAITDTGSSSTVIANYGKISGSVRLASTSDYAGSADTFYAATGSSVTGDVRFGDGNDLFIVSLAHAKDFKSVVSGIVDAGVGTDTIRLLVDSSQSVEVAGIAGFERVGYEVAGGNTKLTLTSPTALTSTLALTGEGTIDLTANFNTNGMTALRVGGATIKQITGEASGATNQQSLYVISRGTLSANEVFSAVHVSSSTKFENAGTINVTAPPDHDPFAGAAPAFTGTSYGIYANKATTVVNSGTISMYAPIYGFYYYAPVAGIYSEGRVENSGRIEQIGYKPVTGIRNIEGTVENTGVISVKGIGVSARGSSITNRGTIQSTAASAIEVFTEGYATHWIKVYNLEGGKIIGGFGQAAIKGGYGDDLVSNYGTITRSVELYEGNDTFENLGRVEGDVRLGNGDDTYIHGVKATWTGVVDGGAGTDRLIFDITGGGTVDWSPFTSFEVVGQRGRGEVTFKDENIPFERYELHDTSFTVAAGKTFATQGSTALLGSGGAEIVNNQGVIKGSIDLGAGADRMTNVGRLEGSVLLGAGNDTFSTHSSAVITGEIRGGEGLDTFEFEGTREELTRLAIALLRLEGFEVGRFTGGTIGLTSDVNQFAEIDVTGGYVFGFRDTIIEAGIVDVGAKGVFGTAGKVKGNINVAGTLSPGSSPGTMTVIGNINLEAGSNTLFELTPTVSDQLLISGVLNITSGATLELTGSKQLAPGSFYDLIVAEGGINGDFKTKNTGGIRGFAARRGNRIQLYGLFANSDSFSPQVRASVDYVNHVLMSGQASAAFANVMPDLMGQNGAPVVAAFERLTPEAYATSIQTGIEHGLIIADLVRGRRNGPKAEGLGLYGWAQGVGNWRSIDASASNGTAATDINTNGLVGGLGFLSKFGEVGAFIGFMDTNQSLDGRNTQIETNGVIGGVYGDFEVEGFGLHALIAYDGANAEMRRSVAPLAASAESRFDLGGWTFDLSADYDVKLAEQWTVRPSVGLTYILLDRDAAVETGAGPFGLELTGDAISAWFADAAVTFAGSIDVGSKKLWPFASVGLRHQLKGNDVSASARLTGTTGDPLTVRGAERSSTAATLGTGFSFDLTSRVRLSAAYDAELASKGSRHNGSARLSIRF